MKRSILWCTWKRTTEASKKEQLSLLKRREASKVRNWRELKRTTNPYNKAQYINAFIDAKSSALQHTDALRLRHPEPRVLTSSPELELLSTELSERYPNAIQLENQGKGKGEGSVVEFGAWREEDPGYHRKVNRLLTKLHCITREAVTPPSFSREAFLSDVSAHSKLVDRLRRELDDLSDVKVSDLVTLYQALVKPLERLHFYKIASFAGLFIQEAVARSVDGNEVVQFVGWLLQDKKLSESEVCGVVGAACESIRYADLQEKGIPLMEWNKLVQITLQSLGKGTRLPPVLAAPLLSILYPQPGLTAGYVEEQTKSTLVKRQGKHQLHYLPSVAWGEFIKAMARLGSPLSEIQRLVDEMTDPSRTAHAEALLSDPLVWGAYLRSSPCAHAVEVFHSNRKHYGVKETAYVMASLMHSLNNTGQEKEAKEALRYARQLRQNKTMWSGTVGVYSEYMRALGSTGQTAPLLQLPWDYENFLNPFGVSYDVFERTRKSFEEKESFTVEESEEFLRLLCKDPTVYFPPKLVHEWQRCVRRAASDKPKTPSFTLSAEDLMDSF